MKGETDRQIIRYSLPTPVCFIFLTHRTIILEFNCLQTNGTLAFAPTHGAYPSVKSKEPFIFYARINIRILDN